MAIATHPDRSWLPMKDISPPIDDTEGDCSSPITIVAQDYLDDPPVRDIPLPASDSVHTQDAVCVQTDATPPNTDISHAIAATASAVASSIPLTQLQRSIDMFCSTLLARTEHTHNQPIQTDRYSLRMIEDLDYIKYQLSANQKPSVREFDQLKEFQNEINQLKLKLDERSTPSQFYSPLSDLHKEICSLKTALANRSPSPTPVYNKHTSIDTFPDNVLASKECQTSLPLQQTPAASVCIQTSLPVQQAPAASVCIQTSPPVQLTRPRRRFVSPIHTSSPLSHSIPTPASLPNKPPLTKLTRIENKLRDIKMSQRQIATKHPPRTHSLHLADIVRQVVDSDRDDVTHRTRQLVSDKLDSIPAMQREQASKKDANIQVKNSKTQIRRGKPSDKHEKDPVYKTRVYGDKKVADVKVRSKQSGAEIAGVYKQIESIRTQVQQLATSRPQPAPTVAVPLRQPTQYHSYGTPVYRAAKLIRPPRLIPSPSSPLQQTPVQVITYDNAQVQTSFLSPVTPAVSTHSPTPLQDSIESVEVTEHDVDRIVCSSPSLTQLTDTVSQAGENQLIEQMISLQADEMDAGEEHPLELPTQLSDPVQLMREQELGRRHLFERVQHMLVQRATESLSDQVRLTHARELQQKQIRLTAAVEDVIRHDVIDYIRTAREEMRATELPRSPERDSPSELEEEYSLSFASESDEASDCGEQLLNNTLTPHSTFVTPLSPTTPRFVPSPHTQAFPLPLSPPPTLIPLTPEPILSPSFPIFAEVQCDLRGPTPPSSPALSIQTSLSIEPEPVPPALPPSVATQCDINIPSQLDVAIQCDTPHSPPYLTIPRFEPIKFDIPLDDSSSYYLTDVSPSTDNPSILSEGEYVPRYSRRHRPHPPVDPSSGELGNLSPAVEAALLLKNQSPDISPGEVMPSHVYRAPVRPSTQREEVFTPRVPTSIHPNPPHFDIAPEPTTPPNSEGSDSLSRSVTLSLAFSSPSNKTTTRHRDGVDVFDVSSLEGLPVLIGWEHKGDSSPLNPDQRQPHHSSDTHHLDKSTNSTTCDVHSIDSFT